MNIMLIIYFLYNTEQYNKVKKNNKFTNVGESYKTTGYRENAFFLDEVDIIFFFFFQTALTI